MAGTANSTDFPTTAGAFQMKNHAGAEGNPTGFITVLNNDSTGLVYSTLLGGTDHQGGWINGIAIDALGHAYVTGFTTANNYPTTPGALQTAYPCESGGCDGSAFVAEMNTTGTALVYSTFLGGSNGDETSGSGIAIDATGNTYITGTTFSTNFPTTPGVFQTVKKGKNNGAFVTKLNSSGAALVYSTYLSGSGTNSEGDAGSSIKVDASGNVYVAGSTFSLDFPVTTGAFQTVNKSTISEPVNAFVTKLNASGTELEYSTYLGGSYQDQATSIAVDASGYASVTGVSYSSDFPATANALKSHTHSPGPNAFFTKLNQTGTALAYSSYLGGTGVESEYGYTGDVGYGIALDVDDNVYVTGAAGTTDFPVTAGAFQTVNKASTALTNAFVTKFALSQPIAQFSTTLQDFPSVALRSDSAPPVELLTVTNAGTGTLRFTTRVNAPNYEVLDDGQNTCTSGLAAGQSCTLPVEFVPAGVGIHTDTLTLTAATGIGAGIQLRGTATGIGDVSESPLDFGSIAYGATKVLPLTIVNYGVAGSPTVAVSFNNASYSLASGGTCVTAGVAAGQTCTVMIKFSPVGHGVHRAGIILTPAAASGAAASIVPVLGTATTP